MREFNLEEAQAGAKLCTREGGTARIICYDCDSAWPIIALVRDVEEMDEPAQEYPEMYFLNGMAIEAKCPYDLMMVD